MLNFVLFDMWLLFRFFFVLLRISFSSVFRFFYHFVFNQSGPLLTAIKWKIAFMWLRCYKLILFLKFLCCINSPAGVSNCLCSVSNYLHHRVFDTSEQHFSINNIGKNNYLKVLKILLKRWQGSKVNIKAKT